MVQNKGSKYFCFSLSISLPSFFFSCFFSSSFYVFLIQGFECEDGVIIRLGGIFTCMISFDPHSIDESKAEEVVLCLTNMEQ